MKDLFTRIKVKRSFFRSEWVDVKTLMFSTTSCVIKTDELYQLGDSVTLSFRLKLDLNEIVVEELTGTVLHKEKDCSCFHYTIDFSSLDGSSLAGSQVRQIDSILRKKTALNNKLNSVSRH